MKIPFNMPFVTGKEIRYIEEAIKNAHLSGDGPFSKKCHAWLEKKTGAKKALLTHSGTAALEMAAILADIKPGDEVIMPSYTFVSTANAVVLRGGVPVFVDIRSDTMNIDETKIEEAITEKTKAIIPVHYGGVSCEMDTIMNIASRHNLTVIEDAAQAVMCEYKGKPLGSIGHLGCISFHETKNIHSGEGGALLVNDENLAGRAEIIREKGTNRSAFIKGEVDKYTWVDIGSSFLPGDMTAAFLYVQMESAQDIINRRLEIWNSYHDAFLELERAGKIRRPIIPPECRHNGHLYYLLLENQEKRDAFISCLKKKGVHSVFHYIPLHNSPAGKKYCRTEGALPLTEEISGRLVRLPVWAGMDDDTIKYTIRAVEEIISGHAE
ncbi:MAG: dTDP-4-amino-4,6-dideoxygalactose transaminase [Chloroflexi bacterium]|nr:dTDP-4-amino-4,6-dideoxygalactose transaminase [Chloroflexota bacterium]